MNEKIADRTGSIDFLKFIFAIIIALYHAGSFFNTDNIILCGSGFIAVEFYFIVSGFLLASKSFRNQSTNNIWNDNLSMIKHKIIHIFPYMIVACFFSNVIYAISEKLTISSIGHNLLFSVVDFLGLQMAGYNSGFFATGVSWYISALLIISFILYPLLCKYRQFITKYVAPIFVIFVYGYILHTSGNMNNPGEWWGWIYKGLLRGAADILVGCIAFEFKIFLDKTQTDKRILLSGIEVLGFIITLCYSIFHRKADNYDFFIIPFLCFSVAIAFSNKDILYKLFNKRIFKKLGIFSLSIYLNHFYLRQNLTKLFPTRERTELLLIYLIGVMLLSVLNYLIGKLLSKFVNNAMHLIIITILWICIGWGLQLTSYYL